MLRSEPIEALAALFTYPRRDYEEAVRNAVGCASAAAPALLVFAEQLRRASLPELEELYTNTFDLHPVCSLDLGWHLFGEDYERGLFLSRMRRELRAHHISESLELPDHLSHALLLLSHMEAAEAEDFALAVVAPALERMLKAMPDGNIFTSLVRSAEQLIRFYFPALPGAASRQGEGVTL